MPSEFEPMPGLPEVVLVKPRAFGDERGWFMETFKKSEFEKHGISGDFRQDNHSRTVGKGILRGLHFQTEPMEQAKLVRCVVGEIFDVAVDIRKGSPTYLKWVSTTLSAENRHMLWIPAGFAHGVQALSETAEIVYKVTNEYSPAHDRSVQWNDPAIGVKWPLPPGPLSKKDAEAKPLKDTDVNFTWRKH